MQVYAGVETLTNQPTAAERAAVPHHLVGYLPLTAASSVGAHAPRAHAAIDGRGARGAAARRRRHGPLPARRADRSRAAALGAAPSAGRTGSAFYDERGGERALAELARARPARRGAPARERPPPRRARPRARRAGREPRARAATGSGATGMRRPAVVAVVTWPRDELRARIAARTAAMLAGGAVDEVRGAARERRRAVHDGGAHPRPRADRRPPRRPRDARRAAAEIALRTGSTRGDRRRGHVGSREPSSSRAPTARSATPTACWS